MKRILKTFFIITTLLGLGLLSYVGYDEYTIYSNKQKSLSEAEKFLNDEISKEEDSKDISIQTSNDSKQDTNTTNKPPDTPVSNNTPTVIAPTKKIVSSLKDGEIVSNYDGVIKGTISIPSFGISGALREGVSTSVIKYSIGHYPQTGWPGDKKQIFLAGHNDREFRILNKVSIGKSIFVRTKKGNFEYIVTGSKIVNKDDVSVIDPSQRDKDELVLMTCYPINYYFSDAPQRFLVYASPK